MVAALFCRARSVYAALGCDVYDARRDARTFPLDAPVVAHPPCRAWGQLSHFAKPRPDERDLAWWAVHVVRHCGGVLEHPRNSALWREIGCGTPGVRDRFGGVFVTLDQSWFGHRARKRTGLYVVGAAPDIVAPELVAEPCTVVERMGRAERERTPEAFARLLVNLAGRCA